MKRDELTRHNRASTVLRMPQLSLEEIDGLLRTFNMYVYFDKSWWPMIEMAERGTPAGEAAFERLAGIFSERFLSGTQGGR
jgi:hypothetical protein